MKPLSREEVLRILSKHDIVKIKEDYITKTEFFREQTENRRKLDRIMDILLEIKGENRNNG